MRLPITLDGTNYGKERKVSDGIYISSDWADVLIPFESDDQKNIACRMDEIKRELEASDYRAMKYIDGLYTEEEYQEYKLYRQSLRDEYNELESRYTPPSYTTEQLENAKKLFLDRDWQMRKDASGDPFIRQLDIETFRT